MRRGRPPGSKNKATIEREKKELMEKQFAIRSGRATRSRTRTRTPEARPTPGDQASRRRSRTGHVPRNQIINMTNRVKEDCTPGDGDPQYSRKTMIGKLRREAAKWPPGAIVNPTTVTMIKDLASMMRFLEEEHLLTLRYLADNLTDDMNGFETKNNKLTIKEALEKIINRRSLALQPEETAPYEKTDDDIDEVWDRSFYFLFVAHTMQRWSMKIANFCMLYMRLMRKDHLYLDAELAKIYERVDDMINDFRAYVERTPMSPAGQKIFDEQNPFKDRYKPSEEISLSDSD